MPIEGYECRCDSESDLVDSEFSVIDDEPGVSENSITETLPVPVPAEDDNLSEHGEENEPPRQLALSLIERVAAIESRLLDLESKVTALFAASTKSFPEVLTVEQVAEYTGYTSGTIRQARYYGIIPFHENERAQNGKRKTAYFLKSEIDDWVNAGGMKAARHRDTDRIRREIAKRELNIPC